MSRLNRLGLESADVEDEGINGEEGAGEVTERPEESVETQLVETEKEEASTAVDDADGQQLIEDLRAVVSQAEVVIDSLEEGGMSETAARSTEQAVESICNRWNIKRKKIGIESFSGSSRHNATQLGLEGILDTVTNIGRRIIDWIMRKLNTLKAVWDKYVNVGKFSKGRIEKLQKKVRELRGSVESGEKLPEGCGWQLRHFKGTDTRELFGVKDADTFIKVLDSLDETCGLYLDEAGELMLKQKDKDAKVTRVEPKYHMQSGSSETNLKKLFPAKAGSTDRKIYPMPGGAILVYTDQNDNCCWEWSDITMSYSAEREAKPWSVDTMIAMLNRAFDRAQALNQYYQKRSKTVNNTEKLRSKITKAKAQFDKAFDKKDASSESVGVKRKAVESAKIAFDNAMEIDRIYRKSTAAHIQAVINVVNASCKLHKVDD